MHTATCKHKHIHTYTQRYTTAYTCIHVYMELYKFNYIYIGNTEDLFSLVVEDYQSFNIQLVKNISNTRYNAWILIVKFVSPDEGMSLATINLFKTTIDPHNSNISARKV